MKFYNSKSLFSEKSKGRCGEVFFAWGHFRDGRDAGGSLAPEGKQPERRSKRGPANAATTRSQNAANRRKAKTHDRNSKMRTS